MLKTKSAGSPKAKSDGLRILAARFRARGMKKDAYDVWMPSLGPSEALLRSFLDDEISWKAFSLAYREEMFAPSSIDERNKTIRNRGQLHAMRLLKHLASQGDVTLMCHCDEDTAQCHRFLLQDLIESNKV